MERNILVPVVGEDIGILSILVPKDVICQIEQEALEIPVSYTHLTLPTILRV